MKRIFKGHLNVTVDTEESTLRVHDAKRVTIESVPTKSLSRAAYMRAYVAVLDQEALVMMLLAGFRPLNCGDRGKRGRPATRWERAAKAAGIDLTRVSSKEIQRQSRAVARAQAAGKRAADKVRKGDAR